MILLAEAQDFDGTQPFLLTEFTKALFWQGTANGKKENSAGSDWAVLFKETMGFDVDEDGAEVDDEDGIGQAGVVKVRGKEFDYIDLKKGSGGALQIYCDDSKIVLVDVAADDKVKKISSYVGKKCEVPSGKDFEKYISAEPKSKKAHAVVEFTVPWAVVMSSTASLEKSLAKAKKKWMAIEDLTGDIHQIADNLGGQLVIFRLTKGKYNVYLEDEVEKPWGAAQRLIMKRQKK